MSARLVVVVQRVGSSDGSLVVGLCGTRERWLVDGGYDFGAVQPLDGAETPDVSVVIENVPTGSWALSVFHDLDGNGTLDRGAFGIPAEPWGFGNDPPALGAARFDAALVEVTAPETRVEVTLRGGAGPARDDAVRPAASSDRPVTDPP